MDSKECSDPKDCIQETVDSSWAKRKDFHPHESPLRSMWSEVNGEEFCFLCSLTEAQRYVDGVLIMEGDYGGQIYLVCPVSCIHCSEEALEQLLTDIDSLAWECNNGKGKQICYERYPLGTRIGGGMGGGLVRNTIWIHPKLLLLPQDQTQLELAILEVIFGRRARIEPHVKSVAD